MNIFNGDEDLQRRYADALKTSVDKTFGVDMNNEPVAWAREDGVIAFHKKPEVDSQGFKWYALYTHPVKELTDEEIDMLVHEYNCIDDYPHEFVRACIRKASEI